MSANDKFGLGYGDHRYDGILSYENEMLQSVFMNKQSEIENQPLYDRFVTAEGMHVVPPPMTGNYMPSGPEIEVDYSQFTYGPKQTQPSESESQSSESDTCESNISTEPSELVSEPVVNESNVECQPKVWSDAPIIEEYESDSEDECVSIPTKQQETPSFANQQVKTPRENVKSQFTHSQKPKVDKKDLGNYPHRAKDKGIVDRDCSRHMTWEQGPTLLNSKTLMVPWESKEYSNCHITTQQNGVAERKNRTLIEAARTMLADSFLPNTFWAEAVSTACYVLNRVLVTKPHNKTPYELLTGQQEANQNAGTEDIIDAGDSETEDESAQDCFVLPIWPSYSQQSLPNLKTDEKERWFQERRTRRSLRPCYTKGAAKPSSTNIFSTVSTPAKASSTNLVNTVSIPVSTASLHEGLSLSDPTNPEEDTQRNLHIRIFNQHSTEVFSLLHRMMMRVQWLRSKLIAFKQEANSNKSSGAHRLLLAMFQKQKEEIIIEELPSTFPILLSVLSQHEPKKISEALEDESWVVYYQEELMATEESDRRRCYLNSQDKYFARNPRRSLTLQMLILLVTNPLRTPKPLVKDEKPGCGCPSHSHSQSSHLKCCQEKFLVPKGKTQLEKPQQELFNFLVEDPHFLAMQKASHCATSTNRSQYVLLLQAA
ncbi:putative ribonuclease H-like domain-containing protein [Tanacetum coccineum]